MRQRGIRARGGTIARSAQTIRRYIIPTTISRQTSDARNSQVSQVIGPVQSWARASTGRDPAKWTVELNQGSGPRDRTGLALMLSPLLFSASHRDCAAAMD